MQCPPTQRTMATVGIVMGIPGMLVAVQTIVKKLQERISCFLDEKTLAEAVLDALTRVNDLSGNIASVLDAKPGTIAEEFLFWFQKYTDPCQVVFLPILT